MSPGLSLGRKENGVPSLGQKPSMRPGRPSRVRPTASPHLAQKRRSSGSTGSGSTRPAGSATSAGSIETSPAPRRWVPLPAVLEVPGPCVRLVAGPLAEVDDGIEGIDGIEGSDAIDGPPVADEGVELGEESAARAPDGAFVPHTSQ